MMVLYGWSRAYYFYQGLCWLASVTVDGLGSLFSRDAAGVGGWQLRHQAIALPVINPTETRVRVLFWNLANHRTADDRGYVDRCIESRVAGIQGIFLGWGHTGCRVYWYTGILLGLLYQGIHILRIYTRRTHRDESSGLLK
jgi:hypothetical protein